jgi:putative two-component system response regulator
VAETLAYIASESGKHFDPKLAPLLKKNLPEILVIKSEYADPELIRDSN